MGTVQVLRGEVRAPFFQGDQCLLSVLRRLFTIRVETIIYYPCRDNCLLSVLRQLCTIRVETTVSYPC